MKIIALLFSSPLVSCGTAKKFEESSKAKREWEERQSFVRSQLSQENKEESEKDIEDQACWGYEKNSSKKNGSYVVAPIMPNAKLYGSFKSREECTNESFENDSAIKNSCRPMTCQ